MRSSLNCAIFIFCAISSFGAESIDQFNTIKSYFHHDWDSAKILSHNMLEKAEKEGNMFGKVKGNLFLGYILKAQKDYGKSVLYFLEGIRHAEKASYEGIEEDKIWLRRNIANTFRKFEVNELATKYNLEAIDIALNSLNKEQVINLKLNQALVYQNDEQYDKAIQLLNEILPLIDDSPYRQSEIINQIGLAYLEASNLTQAEIYFKKAFKIPSEKRLFNSLALHNLGEIYFKRGNIELAIDNLSLAINLMEQMNKTTNYNLFISYSNMGLYLSHQEKYEEALQFLTKAEKISSYMENNPEIFKLYKRFSNIYFSEGNIELGKQYTDLYYNKVESFLKTQEEIQRKDKEYNFELITKRYFDQIEKEERETFILFYFKLISGTLFFLLLATNGYTRYKKIRLRRTLERELKALKVV